MTATTPRSPAGAEATGPGGVRRLRAAADALLYPVVALVLAFVIGALLVLVTGNDPVAAFAALLRGGFGSARAWGRTIVNATPLIFTGLAVALPFRAGLFNIGGEGQLFIGAVTAAWLGVTLTGIPGPLAIIVVLAASALAGFTWGALPGLFKLRGAHEVITTIMLNFVAINFATWLLLNPLSGGGLVPGSAPVASDNRLWLLGLGLGRADWGFVLGLGAAAAAYALLWRTPRGFEIRAVGLAPGAARYAGMSVAANTVLALAIGGLFAGMGGGVEVLGVFGKMPSPFVSNLGFNGIGVALLGRNHPVGVVLGALFFGGLQGGAQEMQFATDVPLDLADVLLAIVLLLVTASRLVELLLGRRGGSLAGLQRLEHGVGV